MPTYARHTRLLILQSTTFCNLDCKYCYLPNRDSRKVMVPATAAAAVRNLRESGLLGDRLAVVWHAGEPLTVPLGFYQQAIPSVAEFATEQLTIRQSIQTNGTLLTPAHCELFRQHDVSIGLSLDGPAFLHDAQRVTRSGKTTHAAVMRGLGLLQEYGIEFNVIAVLTDASLDYPDEMYAFFRDAGVRRIGFNIDEAEGINRTSSFRHPDGIDRYRRFMRRMFDLCRQDDRLSVREFDEFAGLLQFDGDIGVNTQAQPLAIINVAADGDFSTFSPELLETPHVSNGGFRLGNVHTDRIGGVRRDLRALALFRDVEDGVEACRRECPYFAMCGGGAPSNKLTENGRLDSTETTYCRYTVQTLADLLMEAHEEHLATAGAS